MGSDFIYILSSLPLLKLSGEGAMEYGAFLESCGGMLRARERETLSRLVLEEKPGVVREEPVLREWDQWLETMRQVSALWRAARRPGESAAAASWRPRREAYPGDVRRLEAILAMEGLAAKQDAWESLQWSRLEELSLGLGFSFSALVAYALKLRLLESRARRTLASGTRVFEALVASRLEEAVAGRRAVEE
ncbi:MAG: hypothetical protein ACI4SG_04510 [Oligosphaeraceae bacterium]